MKHTIVATALAGLAAAGGAWAHGDAPHQARPAAAPASTREKAFGREGDPARVSRSLKVVMADTMRYSPSEIAVKRGETVRIEASNSGRVVHEIVLGTMKDLRDHAEMMKKHPGMEHDEPYMVHVAPGATGRIVWQFTRPGEFFYGCLVPGHFEAGMVGKIIVK